ncbi:MAG: alpha-mannosidase [Armatimonadota bacterium]
MTENKKTMHVLSHTHWDREWYQDFQGFRQRLVFQIDALLDLMEQRPEYRHFHLDGQTSCLMDYLEIRPENKERLTKLICDGRILIGPWFVMPDELLLSGESLVRNLLMGKKFCGEFGAEPMPIGYVTDIFGHCSQFPQILKGFNIDTAMLQRGTSGEDGATELVWEGADGSTVLLVKCFPYGGYGDLFMMYDKSDEELLEYEQRKLSLATTDVLFAMDGSDHAPAKPQLPGLLEKFNKVFQHTRCIHSSMVDYLRDLKKALGSDWEQTHRRYVGELRLPNKKNIWGEVFQGTGSSRVYLKQANDSLEYLLPRCAEPLHVWSKLLGGDDQKAFLNLAWNYLLLNHPHDSMVGCSIDKVHTDMMYRFGEATSLAWNSMWESVQTIGDKLNTISLGEGLALTVYNMASVDTDQVVRISFEIPQGEIIEKRKQGFAPALFDNNDNPILMHIESSEPHVTNIPVAKKFYGETPQFWVRDEYGEIERFSAICAASIPSLGYDSFRIGYLPANELAAVNLTDCLAPVISLDYAIENKFIQLTARPDGLVDLFDKVTGIAYEGLHELEDCGDVGTGWDHIYPQIDTVIRSTDADHRGLVSISINQDGPLSASITVNYSLMVPKGVVPDNSGRLTDQIAINIQTVYTLNAGSHRVDCHTTIDNKALNHRMRAIFPTDRNCDTWFCDTAFDMVERDIELFDTSDYLEKKREESPIKNMVAACDGNVGLAVITKGLCEACVQDNDHRSIALTLFRGFAQSIGGHATKESQMQGMISMDYALVPFASENDRPPMSIFAEIESFKMPVVCFTGRVHDGDLPVSGQLLKISGRAVLSTIKASEDGKSSVIRLFNPDVNDRHTTLEFVHLSGKVQFCDIGENEIDPIESDGNSLTIMIPAKKVVSIKYQV